MIIILTYKGGGVGVLITYQKRNGEIFQRTRNTYCPYRIGDITSMGWVVMDIKYKWGNRYYSSEDYSKLVNKDIKRDKKRIRIKKSLVKVYRELTYCLFLLILFRFVEFLIRLTT